MTTPSHIAGYTAEQLQAVAQAAEALQTAAESNWTLARLTFENTRKGGGPFTLQEWSTLVQERAGRRFSTATAGRYSKMWAEHSTKVEKLDWTEARQAQYPSSTQNVPTVADPSEALLKATARRIAIFVVERADSRYRDRRDRHINSVMSDRDEFIWEIRKELSEVNFIGEALDVMSEDTPEAEKLTDLVIQELDRRGYHWDRLSATPEDGLD